MKIKFFPSLSLKNIERMVTTNTHWSCGMAIIPEKGTIFASYCEGEIFIIGTLTGYSKKSSDPDAPILFWDEPEKGKSEYIYEIERFSFSNMVFIEKKNILQYLWNEDGTPVRSEQIGPFIKEANISLKDLIILSRGTLI